MNLKAKKRTERSALLSAASKNKTFRECATAYMEAHSSDYTSDKHRKQWPATLEAYAYKLIGNMLVSDIAMRDVKNVLEQETTATDGQTGKLWFVKTETAKRLLGRIKTVLDFATVNEYLCQLLQYRLKFKLHGMTYLTAHFCTATDRDSN